MNSNNLIQSLLKNIYSLSIVGTGLIVFLVQLFGMTSPTFDKFLAFAESALMLYLGGPTAAALAKVLLQTMPDPMIHNVEHNMRLIQQQVPHVVSIDKVHFWQNAYGKFIGTLEIGVRPEAEEDAVIDASFDIMEPLVRENGGELTISVTKMQ
jgi:Co/Zn/Cd efflux system component